jgi:hypothetical protein
MSLTSYRAAPPRGKRSVCQGESVVLGFAMRLEGLAATYSPASCDAVPLALRVFTAEFGMGSGVLPLAVATKPSKRIGEAVS